MTHSNSHRLLFRRTFLTLTTTFILALSGLMAHAQSAASTDYSHLVELNRKILFLISGESDNEVSRQRDTFIARNFYYEKQHSLEELETSLLEISGGERSDQIRALFDFLYSDAVRAADALTFIDLVDNLLSRHTEQPFLNQTELRQLRQLEQQMLVIQDTYQDDISELYNALGTRGLELEPWQDYLDFLNNRYDRNEIYREFNQAEPALNEPAVRGAESNQGPDLVWGYDLPDKSVVLTFDDGPHHRNTGAILDVLKEYDAKGYFFAVGQNIGAIKGESVTLHGKSDQLQRALREGHILANHSFSHSVLTKLTEDEQIEELDSTNRLIKAVSGHNTQYFRPPYGAKNDRLVELSKDAGMRSIMWNVDSKDWADPIPQSIVDRVMADLEEKEGGILLFHDIHRQTVQALPLLLEELNKAGYNVVTLDGTSFSEQPAPEATTEAETTSVESQLYRESWALVIGVNDYQYWPQLSYAVNDAKSIEHTLVNKFGFKEDHVYTLFDEEANRENITEHLANILSDPARVKPNDRVFVFYAGHGMTRVLPSGRNLGYIIPVDAELDRYHSRSISMTHLQDFSDMIPAKHVYFIMDSCYSGIALTRSGGRQVRSNYLDEIASRPARQILTAGGADQEVADGGPEGHSIFTWSLLRGLDGEADLDNNNIITASELGAYVSPMVAENSNQTPAFGNLVGNEGGEFLFELAPVNLSDASLSEEERLRAQLLELQKENATLKQKLAELTDAQTTQAQQALEDTVSQLSLTERKLKANEFHAQGLKHYRDQDYKSALSALKTALAFNPTNPGLVNDYGFILYRDGQYEEALYWLEKTIELDADRIPIYLNIADTLVKLDRKPEAVPYYEYYLKLYPDSPVKDRVVEAMNS